MIVDIVTGATQGIGRAIAESIAHHRSLEKTTSGYALFLTGRNESRGQAAADQISKSSSLSHVHFEACDLSDYDSVQDFSHRIGKLLGTDTYKVGILVNNAAECPQQQEFVSRPCLNSKGETKLVQLDKQFASNVLGYHFMIKAFQDHYYESTHIVNVASNWAGDLDFNDLQFQRRSYDNDSAYRQSKQANRMLTKVWSDKLQGKALVNSCHPGDPCTTLSKALGYNLWSSPPSRTFIDNGKTIPYLCGFVGGISTTGEWYDGGIQPRTCRFMSRTEDCQRLYDICDSFAVSKST